jgi:hypothetical protein
LRMRAPRCEPDRSAAGSFGGRGLRGSSVELMVAYIGSIIARHNDGAAL